MATSAKQRDKLESELRAREGAPQREASRRLFWTEALTSLWAPLSIFGIAFVFYLLVVELHTPSAAWARPLLKGFGAIMLAYFGGLLAYRNLLPGPKRLRLLRREAAELAREVESVLDRHPEKLASMRQGLVDQVLKVRAARLSSDAVALEAEVEKLSETVEKQLAPYRRSSALEFGSGLAKALAVALLIRAVIIEPFKIPSGSMIPTLEVGDQIFVNKYVYGVRLPWLNKVPFVIVRRPERGDVIVFENPVDSSKDFIKRVVGLPGDSVEIVDDQVFINGAAQGRTVLDPSYEYYDSREGSGWEVRHGALARETLDGRAHQTLHRPSMFAGRSKEGPWTVPEAHVFVLGDNRDNSLDSRYGFQAGGGVEFVPYGHIKGKAMVIWLSLSHGGFLSGLFGGTGLRTDRLFLPVR